jgi:hypothetical protein
VDKILKNQALIMASASGPVSFVKLSKDETVDLHMQAASFIDTHVRTPACPTLKLAPFDQCTVGRTHLTCPIHGTNSIHMTKDLFVKLEDMFGVDVNGEPPEIYNEAMPDGSGIVYKLNLPILFKRSSAANTNAGKGTKGGGGAESIPSLEWPLFLLIVEAGLSGYLYYRHTLGIAF